ncbi:MAG: tetratricopeptide repeat protein, partial [Microcoleaceae cyanobacterium]
EAIDYYRRAIEINPNPNSDLAYNYLGEALTKVGEIEEAIAIFNQAINRNPTSSLLFKNLGDALAKQGKIDEASVAYSRAIELG